MKNISGWLQQQQHGGAEQRDAEPGERDEGPECHRHAAPVPARHPHPVLDTCYVSRDQTKWDEECEFCSSSILQLSRVASVAAADGAAAADSDEILYSMEHFRYLYRRSFTQIFYILDNAIV